MLGLGIYDKYLCSLVNSISLFCFAVVGDIMVADDSHDGLSHLPRGNVPSHCTQSALSTSGRETQKVSWDLDELTGQKETQMTNTPLQLLKKINVLGAMESYRRGI